MDTLNGVKLYIATQQLVDRNEQLLEIQRLEYQGYVYNVATDTWEHPAVSEAA